MSEIIKGPWPDPVDRDSRSQAASKRPGSDWATGLLQIPKVASPLYFRTLAPADQPLLKHWLQLASWDPANADDWGNASDIGLVAVVEGTDAGACWIRLLPAGTGAAFVDAATPQLGLALEAGYRGRGYGTALTKRTLQLAWIRYRQVALSLPLQSPAVALFEACGFAKLGERHSRHLMVAGADTASP